MSKWYEDSTHGNMQVGIMHMKSLPTSPVIHTLATPLLQGWDTMARGSCQKGEFIKIQERLEPIMAGRPSSKW